MSSSHLSKLYKHKLNLLTDLYQLTMAYGYWRTGLYKKDAVFHLFYRKAPFKGHFTIAAGLQLVIDFLQDFRFEPSDIHFLGSLKGADDRPLFDEGFLNHLQRMQFSCDIDAMPEGSVCFPHQPLLRIKGPLIQAQLLETILLNLINFSSLIASKAARIVQAAQGDTVLDFGLRRAQGIDGGIMASRAAYIGGCHATSNVLAGKFFGIPVKGTHAHSWIMCFEDELRAFQQYAQSMPNNCIFLVDTYDTIEGVKKAIQVGLELKSKGVKLAGIRLDSGNLAKLSIAARKLLDEAGLQSTAIVASNDLDEYKIQQLKSENATINVWGVGTRLITAFDQAALGGVYKLAALSNEGGGWDYKIKLSEQAIKVSNPGILQVKRFHDNGLPIGDLSYNTDAAEISQQLIEEKKAKVFNFEEKEFTELLKPVFKAGQLVYPEYDLHQIRAYSINQQTIFNDVALETYPVGLAAPLYELKQELIQKYQH